MTADAVAQGVPPQPPYLQGFWRAPFNHQKEATVGGTDAFFTGEPKWPVDGAGQPLVFNPSPPPRMFPNRPVGDDGIQAQGVHLSLHMALIPKGPRQGKLLVWSHSHYPGTNAPSETRALYWGIVDPVTGTTESFMYFVPEGLGDLFCAGHSWNAEGNLLVAGGTMDHGGALNGGGWTGSVVTYVYDSARSYSAPIVLNSSPWILGPLMDVPRWYPSVAVMGSNGVEGRQLMVAGGTNSGVGENSYQVWYPQSGAGIAGSFWFDNLLLTRLFSGPTAGTAFQFTDYPRLTLHSSGDLVSSGFPPGSDRIIHYNGSQSWLGDSTWRQFDPNGGGLQRGYGSSVLLPIRMDPFLGDYVLAVGGAKGPVVHSSAFQSYGSGTPTQRAWTTGPTLNHPRMFLNTVLLPDGSVLAVGGRQNNSTDGISANQPFGCTYEAAHEPELLVSGQWRQMAATSIIRDYHSVALLLPNGEVMVGGGESREWEEAASNCIQTGGTGDPYARNAIAGPSDYQIYVPPCAEFAASRRPQFTSTNPAGQGILATRGNVLQLTYSGMPQGETVDKVVLMWPGSVTHHADCNQRCVELEIEYVAEPVPQDGTGVVSVEIPSNGFIVPSGYYMAFLVTTEGALCREAVWVQVQ